MMFLDEKKTGEAPVELELWRTVLRDAAAILECDGWCQNVVIDPDTGRRCAIGAIGKAAIRIAREQTGLQDIFERADSALTALVGPIAHWNDMDGQTRENVCALLREAAAYE
jgi:hypothetical protein